MLFLYNIANVAQITFEIVEKSRSREYGDIIIERKRAHPCLLNLPNFRYIYRFIGERELTILC